MQVDVELSRSETAPTRTLRIAHVITRLVNGGADENTVLSCNCAAAAGHDVALIHGGKARSEILARLDPRVDVIPLSNLVWPVSPLADARALRDLVRTFRGFRPDVVHTHTSKAGFLGRLAARITGTRAIVHGVHIVPFVNVGRIEAVVFGLAERIVAGVTDAFVHVGVGTRGIFLDAGIGRRSRHHVVHSGFDLSLFRNAVVSGNDEPTVLMLAAFEPRKRHLEFLKAFRAVVARFPDVCLILAGDGELREDVEACIVTLGLEGNVVLTGFHEHPEQLVALADVCVLASTREGLPRVVMQYLAGGKPVVASNLPGLEEVLSHDGNGLIVPSDDVDALASAVARLLSDAPTRARLAAGADLTDLSTWDAALMGERLQEVYAGVLRDERPRRHAQRAHEAAI